MNRDVIVSARWEAQVVHDIADLIRRGILPSNRNLERLELACKRLSNAVSAMGGDREVKH